MQKKLTITINEQIYEGLYRLVGPRKISGFIEDLVRPHVLYPDLERAYAELTQNTAREGAASEWTSGDTTMVRKQVYLKSQKDMQVKKLAAERGTTETDIIREAVDLLLSEVARQRRAQQAWEEARAFMEDRFAQKQISGERTWTREELYAERLERYEKHSD
jgi:hypothetical protein